MAIGNPTTFNSAFTPTELTTEIFLPVPEWERLYSVSNLGRVRRDKASQGTRVGHILTPRKAKDHFHVTLHLKPGESREYYVHQLVLLAFEGPCPDGQEVSHRDGVPANNRLTNLKYRTRSEHRLYDANTFGRYRGEQNGASHLTDTDIIVIRERFARGAATAQLSHEYQTSKSQIYRIIVGATWKHIGGPIYDPSKPKLTNEDVREIHRRARMGVPQKQLAVDFNIDGSTVNNILKGRKWAHIAKEFPEWCFYRIR